MNPSIFLPLLTNLTTYPSNTSTNDLTPEGCFPLAPSQPPAVFADCIGIITQQISPYPDHTTPLTFSRTSSFAPDIKTPYVRYAENCAIVLDVPDGDVVEHTTMGDVITQAKEISVECVIKGEAHQGGERMLGWRRGLKLTVLGRSAPTPPQPLQTGGGFVLGAGGVEGQDGLEGVTTE